MVPLQGGCATSLVGMLLSCTTRFPSSYLAALSSCCSVCRLRGRMCALSPLSRQRCKLQHGLDSWNVELHKKYQYLPRQFIARLCVCCILMLLVGLVTDMCVALASLALPWWLYDKSVNVPHIAVAIVAGLLGTVVVVCSIFLPQLDACRRSTSSSRARSSSVAGWQRPMTNTYR